MTHTHQPGNIYYLTHPEMDHGQRPHVLMGEANGQALLMALSTIPCRQLGNTDAYYLPATDTHAARGHAAPNRTQRFTINELPAPDGYTTHEELMLIWDAWDDYRTPRRR